MMQSRERAPRPPHGTPSWQPAANKTQTAGQGGGRKRKEQQVAIMQAGGCSKSPAQPSPAQPSSSWHCRAASLTLLVCNTQAVWRRGWQQCGSAARGIAHIATNVDDQALLSLGAPAPLTQDVVQAGRQRSEGAACSVLRANSCSHPAYAALCRPPTHWHKPACNCTLTMPRQSLARAALGCGLPR